MKTWITVLCAVALLSGCVTNKPLAEAPKVVVAADQLEERDGLQYFEEKPFTGVGVAKYENGQKSEEGTNKDGKFISSKKWNEDGNRRGQGKSDIRKEDSAPAAVEAPKVVVDVDQLEQRDDLMYFKEKPFTGVSVMKYPNGKKEGEGTHKDGKLMTATVWKPNGEKCPDTNLVNGTGIVCGYHENGQKNQEVTLKDGKLISAKGWDEDGNLTREYPKP